MNYKVLALALIMALEGCAATARHRSPYTDLTHKEGCERPLHFEGSDSLYYLADTLGDGDGEIDGKERDSLRGRVCDTDEFYILTTPPSNNFEEISDDRIYGSEEAIRDSYEDIGIKGFVGILRFNRKGDITGAWSSFGYISDKEWTREEIPDIDFKEIMEKRKSRN